jgi:hypothetical protein
MREMRVCGRIRHQRWHLYVVCQKYDYAKPAHSLTAIKPCTASYYLFTA